MKLTRRHMARLLGGATASTFLPFSVRAARTTDQMLLREIPSTGEQLPAIGLGTSGTFDVGDSSAEREPLRTVLRQFERLGGKVIDTSPMYGRAEEVIGDLISELRLRDQVSSPQRSGSLAGRKESRP